MSVEKVSLAETSGAAVVLSAPSSCPVEPPKTPQAPTEKAREGERNGVEAGEAHFR